MLSIDTKKKGMIGNFKRNGKAFCQVTPRAFDYDFTSYSNCTIVPHGIYDVGTNTGYLTIGTSHDTSGFGCDNICRTWT
ncbi:MAG: hypothetical protein IJ604_05470 [Prevotella sp.]|nr:hypothetical protein [Prevotella sp.]MBR1462814.1 hypothetical protein [Prevotella sp.]